MSERNLAALDINGTKKLMTELTLSFYMKKIKKLQERKAVSNVVSYTTRSRLN